MPTLALLAQTRETLTERAARLREAVGEGEVVDSVARAGAGALPVAEVASVALALAPRAGAVGELAARLRRGSPAVLGYVHDDRLLLDVLAVRDHEIAELAAAVRGALASPEAPCPTAAPDRRSRPPRQPRARAELSLTLGTAGHIDHGKTALVTRLTGTNTDRLREERERGISIELGYAELELPGGQRLSVVDVPGHERFVRTMVAGATGIDLFLLVVAADDGVMPQTVEHLAVIELLGVARGVVALTKTDLVDDELLEMAHADVERFLADTPLRRDADRRGQRARRQRPAGAARRACAVSPRRARAIAARGRRACRSTASSP